MQKKIVGEENATFKLLEASELIAARLTLKNIKNGGKRQKNVFAKIIEKKKLEGGEDKKLKKGQE